MSEAPPLSADGNGNSPGESVPVSLSDAATSLGITLPRLTRLLKRPEFAGGVSKANRPTRTGTRTVTLVSVPVLEQIRLSLAEQKQEQSGAKRSRSEGAEGVPLPPLALQILAEREARLADKDAEIQRLTVTLTETQSALRLAQENLRREQTLRLLPAPQGRPAVLEQTPSVETASKIGGSTEQAQGKQDTGWWARLWGGKG